MTPNYCTQIEGYCPSCSLSEGNRDCKGYRINWNIDGLLLIYDFDSGQELIDAINQYGGEENGKTAPLDTPLTYEPGMMVYRVICDNAIRFGRLFGRFRYRIDKVKQEAESIYSQLSPRERLDWIQAGRAMLARNLKQEGA